MVPDTKGQAALVPIKSSLQLPSTLVVIWKCNEYGPKQLHVPAGLLTVA